MKSEDHKGFTLLELLIVVSIIGLIGTLAAFAFGDSRRRSRDTKRINDLSQFRKAMELAFNQGEGYPVEASPVELGTAGYRVLCGKGEDLGFHDDTSASNCDADKIYVGLFPPDPLPTQAYEYTGGDAVFCIQAELEIGAENFPAGPLLANQEALRSGTCP